MDNYAKEHWMMNVGDVKGDILESVIKEHGANRIKVRTVCRTCHECTAYIFEASIDSLDTIIDLDCLRQRYDFVFLW